MPLRVLCAFPEGIGAAQGASHPPSHKAIKGSAQGVSHPPSHKAFKGPPYPSAASPVTVTNALSPVSSRMAAALTPDGGAVCRVLLALAKEGVCASQGDARSH